MTTSAARANKRVLVAAAKNGRAIVCDVDATKFILAYPRGAYTAARTVEQTKIFDYEAHLQRLGAFCCPLPRGNCISVYLIHCT